MASLHVPSALCQCLLSRVCQFPPSSFRMRPSEGLSSLLGNLAVPEWKYPKTCVVACKLQLISNKPEKMEHTLVTFYLSSLSILYPEWLVIKVYCPTSCTILL